jgi:hypothetical protein
VELVVASGEMLEKLRGNEQMGGENVVECLVHYPRESGPDQEHRSANAVPIVRSVNAEYPR